MITSASWTRRGRNEFLRQQWSLAFEQKASTSELVPNMNSVQVVDCRAHGNSRASRNKPLNQCVQDRNASTKFVRRHVEAHGVILW
jgi:hypothetical protein